MDGLHACMLQREQWSPVDQEVLRLWTCNCEARYRLNLVSSLETLISKAGMSGFVQGSNQSISLLMF